MLAAIAATVAATIRVASSLMQRLDDVGALPVLIVFVALVLLLWLVTKDERDQRREGSRRGTGISSGRSAPPTCCDLCMRRFYDGPGAPPPGTVRRARATIPPSGFLCAKAAADTVCEECLGADLG